MTSYVQGVPCWADLSALDQARAKAWYAGLFGWEYEDTPLDETGANVYSMAASNGAPVGGMYTQPDDQKQRGTPPHWLVHLAVDDADAIAARAPELGGTVRWQPFDISAAGRMSIIEDPAGATVALWQAKEHAGAGLKNAPNSIVWCELLAADPDRATAFYTELLGVTAETTSMEYGAYTVLSAGGEAVAGVMAMPQHLRERNVPAHWSVYFQVEDVDAAAAAVEASGGQTALAPMDVDGTGRIAYLLDPQGAGFGVMAPAPQ